MLTDGYYVFAYLAIDPFSNLSDIGIRHDQNLSLWKKEADQIELIHYWELERVTGLRKHSKSFYDVEQAIQVINHLLRRYHVTVDDLQGIYGIPQLNQSRIHTDHASRLSNHSLAHLYSTILSETDLFYSERIVALAVDGRPDAISDPKLLQDYSYTGCVVEKGNILDIFPVCSPGPLWAIAKRQFNLEEGTLMALGSASESTAHLESCDVLQIYREGVEERAALLEYMSNLWNAIREFREEDAGVKFNYFDPRFSEHENKVSMAVKEIQKMSILIMESNLDRILQKYDWEPSETYLALAGGYALNCPTNSHLMDKYNFKGFIAPPCVNDGGLSFGMALRVFYEAMGHEHMKFSLKNAYYGDTDDQLEAVLASGIYSEFIISVSDLEYQTVVQDIIEAPIVWFHGAAEIGPRALGNRSLLGDPRSLTTKEQLNVIKKREWWRPVAPIVLETELDTWFKNSRPSPYMLQNFLIRPEKASEVPAILHLDQSARVQSVTREANEEIYQIVKAFHECTGVPMLCNTSLNDKGEPICNTIEQSLNLALRKRVKVVYLNKKRIELSNFERYCEQEPMKRDISMHRDELDRDEVLREWNPHNVPIELIRLKYILMPELHEQYDLKKEHCAQAYVEVMRQFYDEWYQV